MSRAALLVALALVLGCGAKSALEVRGTVEVARDAGRDAPPSVDAGPRACTLVASEPLVVHQDTLGPFDQPEVSVRADGTIELVARRVGDRPEAAEVRARSARVMPDGSVAFVTDSARLFGPSIWMRAGTLGPLLGTCSTLGGPTDLTELRTWDADHRETGRAMPLAALACHDLVGRGDRWLLVTRGIAEGTVVLERQADGRMVRGPANAFEPAVGANVSVTEIDDGFAWVGVLNVDLRTQVVFRDDRGVDSRVDFHIARRTGGAKPSIGSGIGPGSAAVAYYESQELFVTLVSRETGRGLTSIPLAFSMSPDLDPAIVRLDGSQLAISLDYGDADPQGGHLNVAALGDGLVVTDRFALPTRREPSLRFGGVSAAIVDHTAVIHWAEDDESGGRTTVMTLQCR